MTLPGIADVDVFGGHRPEVKVRVDRDRLAANNVSIGQVVAALAKQNISVPAGTISHVFASLDFPSRTFAPASAGMGTMLISKGSQSMA